MFALRPLSMATTLCIGSSRLDHARQVERAASTKCDPRSSRATGPHSRDLLDTHLAGPAFSLGGSREEAESTSAAPEFESIPRSASYRGHCICWPAMGSGSGSNPLDNRPGQAERATR